MLPILHIDRHLRSSAVEINLPMEKVLELLRYDLITGDVESSLRRAMAVANNFSHKSGLTFGFKIYQRDGIIKTMREISYDWASTSTDGKSMVFVNTMPDRNMEILFVSADVSLSDTDGPVHVLTQIQHFTFNDKPYFPLSVISSIEDLKSKGANVIINLLDTLRSLNFPTRHGQLPDYYKFVSVINFTTMEGGTIDWPGRGSFNLNAENTDNIRPFISRILDRIPNSHLFTTDNRHTGIIEVKASRAGLDHPSTFIIIESLELDGADAKNQEWLDQNDPLKSKIRRISVDVWGKDCNYCDLISNLLESDLKEVAEKYYEDVAEWRQKLSALEEVTKTMYEGAGILREEDIPNLPNPKIEEQVAPVPSIVRSISSTPRPWWKFW